MADEEEGEEEGKVEEEEVGLSESFVVSEAELAR